MAMKLPAESLVQNTTAFRKMSLIRSKPVDIKTKREVLLQLQLSNKHSVTKVKYHIQNLRFTVGSE